MRVKGLNLVSLILLSLAAASCGSSDTDDRAMSAADLETLEHQATEVAASFWEAWPDDAIIDRFADDIAFYAPSDGDFTIEGKDRFAPIERSLLRAWAAADPSVEAVWVASASAAYRVAYPHVVWPPWLAEPAEHPPVVFLYVLGIDEDLITRYELWLEDDTLEMLGYGCFAVGGCPEAQAMVDRYIDAWGSGDPASIAALYADDAVFTDSVLGIEATGADEIGALGDRRFGADAPIDIEVVDIYAQTNGYRLESEFSPDRGKLIGIGLHFRLVNPDADVPAVHGVTTFELGARRPDGFDLHPEGLIASDEVFWGVEDGNLADAEEPGEPDEVEAFEPGTVTVSVSGLDDVSGSYLAGVLHSGEPVFSSAIGGFGVEVQADASIATGVVRVPQPEPDYDDTLFPYVSDEPLVVESGNYSLQLWLAASDVGPYSRWVPGAAEGLRGCTLEFSVDEGTAVHLSVADMPSAGTDVRVTCPAGSWTMIPSPWAGQEEHWRVALDDEGPGVHTVYMIKAFDSLRPADVEDLGGRLVWDETEIELCGVGIRSVGDGFVRIGDIFQTTEGCGTNTGMQQAFEDFGLPDTACVFVEVSGTAREHCAPLAVS